MLIVNTDPDREGKRMIAPERVYPQLKNWILAALPPDEYERLSPHMEYVQLPHGQVLIEHGEPILFVYFPNDALISLVTQLSDGATVEAGVAGREGMVGLPVVLGGDSTPMQSVVQIPGTAIKIKARVIRDAFNRGGALHSRLLGYAHALFVEVAQSAACNAHHHLDERLARWLLTSSDAVEAEELPLTQEFIATMMGVRRAGVTCAALTLREAGLIIYNRGHIKILDRDGLEAAACECYRAIKAQFKTLMGNGK
ncbi:MAG TPA: Crp/Fnr family transcriptional regulator [Pyrinomonadaceae bacterium]|nr:Crp/Fnr family transcriptional regulator [Pyrinomonadaceae bacterium]